MKPRFSRALLLLALAVLAAAFAPSSFARATKTVTLVGKVQAMHADYFKAGRATYSYRLHTKHGYVRLRTNRREVNFAGQRVKAHGVQKGRVLKVAPGGIRIVGRRTASAANASGPHHVLVLLVNFQDNKAEPLSAQEVYAREFTNSNSVAAYYQQESFGQVTLNGEVHGYFTINDSSASCNWQAYGADADAAAQAAGINVNNFDNIVYFWPGLQSCGWSGLAYMPGDRSYINGNFMTLVAAHELGHNLGVHHASSFNCTANGQRVPISTSCTASEYGDPFDTMGNICLLYTSDAADE